MSAGAEDLVRRVDCLRAVFPGPRRLRAQRRSEMRGQQSHPSRAVPRSPKVRSWAGGGGGVGGGVLPCGRLHRPGAVSGQGCWHARGAAVAVCGQGGRRPDCAGRAFSGARWWLRQSSPTVAAVENAPSSQPVLRQGCRHARCCAAAER